MEKGNGQHRVNMLIHKSSSPLNIIPMKKMLLVIALMMMIWQSVYAGEYVSGNEFVNQWKEYKKSDAGQSYNHFDMGFYLGFVSGVKVMGARLLFSSPQNATQGQICSVVGKWIDDHPERWADDPVRIVVTALQEAFPLKRE